MKQENKDALIGAAVLIAMGAYAYAWKVAEPVRIVETKIVERIIERAPSKPVAYAPATVPQTSTTAEEFLSMTTYPDYKAEKRKSHRPSKTKITKTRIDSVGVIVISK